MNRFLIHVGALLALAGVLRPWPKKVLRFHLPLDIVIDPPRVKVFIPIATTVLVSVADDAFATAARDGCWDWPMTP